MKRLLVIALSAALLATPALAQFRPSTNLLPEQDRNAVSKGQQMSLRQIYQKLEQRYGGKPVDARRLDESRYLIRWQSSQGRIMNLVVSAVNG